MLTPQILRPLVLEHLASGTSDQVEGAVDGVAELAHRKGLVPAGWPGRADRMQLFDSVQMIMWQLLPQGVLVWGLGGSMSNNDKYPFYRLTELGGRVLADSAKAQPYDPDGFLAEFRRLVPAADPIVVDYLTEAIRAFNSGCYKSAAVMLGGSAEKVLLVLHEFFESKIADPSARRKFEKDSQGISVGRKFKALKSRLDLMVSAGKFAGHHELIETIDHAFPATSELIRRCRNDAGHPDIPTQTDPDTVFLNLRVFTEHARRMAGLLDHFSNNPAVW